MQTGPERGHAEFSASTLGPLPLEAVMSLACHAVLMFG